MPKRTVVIAVYGVLVLAALYAGASVGERQDPAAIRVAAVLAALAASAVLGAGRAGSGRGERRHRPATQTVPA